MQNSVISTWITSLYLSQPSSVVFACKTAPLGPDLQVCMSPRPHLWFWAHITACLAQEWIDYIGSNPHLWFCAYKTTTLGLELQVSVGPRPHLWFLDAKQCLMDRNNTSLWVPDTTCRFCMQNNVICTRMTSLYEFQLSSVFFPCKTAILWPDLQVCMGPRPHLWFWPRITAYLAQE